MNGPCRKILLSIVICMMALVSSSTLLAQDFRATVNGRVTDTSGAALPGVAVTALNPQTNQSATATTNDEGNYTIPFLQPGAYTITAEQTGFKKTAQESVLQVGQTATVDIQMQVGEVTEVVTVTSDAVVLDESKADRGLVIDNARVTELPLNSRNPFMLSTLAPGITYNGPAIYQRPFDNGAIADWSINGGQNRNNEFLMDGAPNNSIAGGNNIAYVPPVDAVQEFKIITNGYDAQYGRSAGGTVNVTTKAGGNDFHGTVYEFARRKFLDANLFLNNAQSRERSDHLLDQYGFVINGPIYLPRFGEGGPALLSGKNKSFFNFSYEGYREKSPLSATLTYPDAAQRRGDFSNLRNANNELILLFEPNSSATGLGRTPISCNGRLNVICPERLNPIARQVLDFYPLPNSTPTSGDPFRNNYFAPIVAADTFKNYLFRFDQNFGQNDKMFFRYAHNKRIETRTFNGIIGNPAEDSQGPLERINYTGVLDYVKTISPTVILNLRASANRYIEAARTDVALGYDIAQLGFPASYASDIPIRFFPRFNFNDYTNLGRGGFGRGITNVFSFQPNMTLIRGNHTARFGLDYRFTQLATQNSGRAAGEFNFNRNATRRNFDADPLTAAQVEQLRTQLRNDFGFTGPIATNVSGNSIASFLLGATGNTFVENVPFTIYGQQYLAPWVQDDWKISRNLTLNLGLRWDFNGPYKERFNRANFGFDPQVVNPISSRLASGTQLRGGLLFAGVNDNPEGIYKSDHNNIQPRAGFAYQVNDLTVVRGGYGLYYLN
ncbi:MAG: TonB-dependent receptor, partial [Pyrinomonadaceae bacterium]|nr:TonB-dependent receptor [Pyrinomonadaceae bacterium]